MSIDKNTRAADSSFERNLSMSNYTAAYPTGVTHDPTLKQFLEAFYAATDSEREEDLERYGDAFTDDAIQEIGDKVSVKGRAGASQFHPALLSIVLLV